MRRRPMGQHITRIEMWIDGGSGGTAATSVVLGDRVIHGLRLRRRGQAGLRRPERREVEEGAGRTYKGDGAPQR